VALNKRYNHAYYTHASQITLILDKVGSGARVSIDS